MASIMIVHSNVSNCFKNALTLRYKMYYLDFVCFLILLTNEILRYDILFLRNFMQPYRLKCTIWKIVHFISQHIWTIWRSIHGTICLGLLPRKLLFLKKLLLLNNYTAIKVVPKGKFWCKYLEISKFAVSTFYY